MNGKKTLSLAIATVATAVAMTSSAQAYQLVNTEKGLKIDLKGDYEIQLRKRIGENDNIEMEYDDLEIKLHASQKFGNGMRVFGAIETDFKREGDGGANSTLDQAWVGLDFGDFEIGLGKTDYATDNFSVEADYEMGPGDGFDQFQDAGDDLIFGNYKKGPFKLYFSTDIAEGDDGTVKDESSVDLVAQYKFSGLDFALAYQDYKADSNSESIDTIGARVKGKAGQFGYGLAYTTNDTRDQIDASLKYKLGGGLDGATGVSQISPDQGDDLVQYYSNIGYSFSKNTKVFAEIGGNDADNTEIGYLTGLRVRF